MGIENRFSFDARQGGCVAAASGLDIRMGRLGYGDFGPPCRFLVERKGRCPFDPTQGTSSLGNPVPLRKLRVERLEVAVRAGVIAVTLVHGDAAVERLAGGIELAQHARVAGEVVMENRFFAQ